MAAAADAMCAICMEDFGAGKGELAVPLAGKEVSCSHEFHRTCIETWAKVKPACPLCRKEMNGIRCGAIVTPILPKDESDEDYESGDDGESSVDNVVCEHCGRGDRDSDLLICDSCKYRGAHFDCAGLPRLPDDDEEEWLCSSCASSARAAMPARSRNNQPAHRSRQQPDARGRTASLTSARDRVTHDKFEGSEADFAWRDLKLAETAVGSGPRKDWSAKEIETIILALDRSIDLARLTKRCGPMGNALTSLTLALQDSRVRPALLNMGILSRFRDILNLQCTDHAEQRHLRSQVLHDLVMLENNSCITAKLLSSSKLNAALLQSVLRPNDHSSAVKLATRLIQSWAVRFSQSAPSVPTASAFPAIKRPKIRSLVPM